MRPVKQGRALGSQKDGSLLGHPSACISFLRGLQVTWHHTGAVVAVCSLQPSSSVPQLTVGRMTTLNFLLPPHGVGWRAATCCCPLMNFQQAEKAANNFFGKIVFMSPAKSPGKAGSPALSPMPFPSGASFGALGLSLPWIWEPCKDALI